METKALERPGEQESSYLEWSCGRDLVSFRIPKIGYLHRLWPMPGTQHVLDKYLFN